MDPRTPRPRPPRLIALLALMAIAMGVQAQGRLKVKLVGAQSMKNLKINGQTLVRHIGNVRFMYGDARISCDSSYMNSAQNSFDAYGHVVITQEGTRITGDMLHFEGNTSWATIWGKEVCMVEDDKTLTTNMLRYNTRQKYATYTTGGVMRTPDLDLSSRRGHLYSDENRVAFAESVVMHNADADAFTDSLHYAITPKLVSLIGPSFLFHDSSFVYCERGSYNVALKQATASQRAYLLHGTYKLFGSTIFYDDSVGYASARGAVVLTDTVNHLSAYGQMAQSWGRGRRSELSGLPFVTLADGPDTLFLRADTLYVEQPLRPDADSLSADTTYMLLRGRGAVRFYRSDIQGVCDSMRYADLDSVAHMFGSPVLWQQNNQMTANLIRGKFRNNLIDRAYFDGRAFMATEEASDTYSQLKGASIEAIFAGGELHTVNVMGGSQAVYYMRDGGQLSAVNRVESDNAVIGIRQNQIVRLRFNQQPKSNLYPIEQASPDDVTLSGFRWHGGLRPASKLSVVPPGAMLHPEETAAARRDELWELLRSGVSLISGELQPVAPPRGSDTSAPLQLQKERPAPIRDGRFRMKPR